MSLPYDTTTQEYVEVIYDLEQEHRVARVTDIAERRGVTKASVSLVLNQLQKKELVDRKQYGHITLTKSGKRLGSTLSKRHQAIKRFLNIIVGVPENIADEDACKLEHILSKESCKAIDKIAKEIETQPQELAAIFNSINKTDSAGTNNTTGDGGTIDSRKMKA